MEWTAQQEDAIAKIARWLKNPNGQQVFRLFGYAGCGKSTIAKHIAQSVAGVVLFAAPTGKAASVLRKMGCDGACTVHSLIYQPKNKCRERLAELEAKMAAHDLGHARLGDSALVTLEREIVEERARLSQPSFSLNVDSALRGAKLLILDESSMVGSDIARDLLSFGMPILAMGDPAQLPPVFGSGFFTDVAPDVMLTDIQRQAKDNPIIRMATDVREGRVLAYGDYGSSRVISAPDPDEIMKCDQVLVGRNATRHAFNRRMREVAGRTSLVEEGDKVICLRNDREAGLLNGSIWWVDAVAPGDDALGLPTVALSIHDEDDTKMDVMVHRAPLEGIDLNMPYWEKQVAQEFCHAGAITGHRSQGSQFNHVVVIDESACFRKDANRWLYTAITRASERLTVVRK